MIFDIVIPLGKPGAGLDPTGYIGPVLRTMGEGLAAGVRHFTLTFPLGWDGEPVIAAARNLIRPMQILAGQEEGAVAAAPAIRVLEGADEHWDRTLIAALKDGPGRMVLLVDPSILLTRQGHVLDDELMQLMQVSRRRLQPVLGTALLPWEKALHLPVLRRQAGHGIVLQMDRRTAKTETGLTVFAGRAILDREMIDADVARSPDTQLFPLETLILAITAPASRIMTCDLDADLTGADQLGSLSRRIQPLILCPDMLVA